MKWKLMSLIFVMLPVMSSVARPDGLTVWGLVENDVKSTQTAVGGRIGYEVSVVEPFIGYTDWPKFETEAGEVHPDSVLSFGLLCHLPDLIDPDNKLPLVAEPYLGPEATWNMGRSGGGFYSGVAGIKIKARIEDRSSMVVETRLSHNFDDMENVNNDWKISAGIRYPF